MAETLLQALLNIQEKAPKVQLEGFNEYTDSHFMQLRDVVAAVIPMLNDEGLLWEAWPSMDAQGRPSLKYSITLVTSKEQKADEMLLMMLKGSPQDLGSALTYARRYALVCVLNLVADRDDDGHAATQAASLPAHDQQPEVTSAPTAGEQKQVRQIIADLAKELRDFPEEWTKTEEWAKQREIDLDSPPADKLRAVERSLRRKLESVQAKAEKEKQPAGSAK